MNMPIRCERSGADCPCRFKSENEKRLMRRNLEIIRLSLNGMSARGAAKMYGLSCTAHRNGELYLLWYSERFMAGMTKDDDPRKSGSPLNTMRKRKEFWISQIDRILDRLDTPGARMCE